MFIFFLIFANSVFCQYLRRPLDLGENISDLKSPGYYRSDGTKSKNGCLHDHNKVFSGDQGQQCIETDQKEGVGAGYRKVKKKRDLGHFLQRYLERLPLETPIPPFAKTLVTSGCTAARVAQRWSSLGPLEVQVPGRETNGKKIR